MYSLPLLPFVIINTNIFCSDLIDGCNTTGCTLHVAGGSWHVAPFELTRTCKSKANFYLSCCLQCNQIYGFYTNLIREGEKERGGREECGATGISIKLRLTSVCAKCETEIENFSEIRLLVLPLLLAIL